MTPRSGPPSRLPRHLGVTKSVPFSNIRRRTVEHMVRSKATSAYGYTSVEVDFYHITAVLDGARYFQDHGIAREGFPLTHLRRSWPVRPADAIGRHPLKRGVGNNVPSCTATSISASRSTSTLRAPSRRSFGTGMGNADICACSGGEDPRSCAERARTKQLLRPTRCWAGRSRSLSTRPNGTHDTPSSTSPRSRLLDRWCLQSGPGRGYPVSTARPDANHHVGILTRWDHCAFDGAYAAAFLRALKDDLESRDREFA